MAHLNLTMIHPFKDGNGRMARALQTLVLAREGVVHPLFSSIEEWLGRNTQDYYDVLAEVGQGTWNPSNSALPWVRFCLKAHYQQAATVIRRHEEYEALFASIETLVERHRLNERMAVPLFNAALGMQVTNARYQKETEQSSHVAGRDLKALADVGSSFRTARSGADTIRPVGSWGERERPRDAAGRSGPVRFAGSVG